MIPSVVLVFALATSTLALPLTTQEQTTGSEGFSPIHTEVPQSQFVEKTGSEAYPQHAQQNSPVQKKENSPVNADHPQVPYTERPVLLPIQPLSVVPQAGQPLRPVIVPAEAITAGRVIIAGIESIQQRNFPEEIAVVEPQVPYQQVVQPVTYTPVQPQVLESNPQLQQPYYPQPVEKQSSVQQYNPTVQGFVPVQVQTLQEQLIKEQQTVENYKPTQVEQSAQVYNVPQNVQQVVVPEYPEKQSSYQEVTGYSPVQTAQQQVQQFEEKQVPFTQGSGYGPVQTQAVESQQQQYQYPQITENVEKQVPQQVLNAQYQQVNPSASQTVNQQHLVEKQGEYPQTYNPQIQTVEQQGVEQVSNQQRVEPFEQSNQQVYNSQPVEQVQSVQSHPVEQQVYSVQQPNQYLQQQPFGYVPSKTSEVEQQQVYNVQPEQVVNYASNFGEKIPQQTVQNLSGVVHPQTPAVQPFVGATQE